MESKATKARMVGINHIDIEVGEIDAALDFYGRLFDFELRGRHGSMAFLDMGDQFIALSEAPEHKPDLYRHFGLVVDDQGAVRRALEAQGIEILPGSFLDFLDPWGNRIQIVEYSEIQFTKASYVLHGMGLGHLNKNANAIEELAAKGMAPSEP
jgi:predicted enzyme related to lactoylglutathione lyase